LMGKFLGAVPTTHQDQVGRVGSGSKTRPVPLGPKEVREKGASANGADVIEIASYERGEGRIAPKKNDPKKQKRVL